MNERLADDRQVGTADLLLQDVGLDTVGTDTNGQTGDCGVAVIPPTGCWNGQAFNAGFGEIDSIGRCGHDDPH